VALALDLGWQPWTCSPLTLRAETAPIVALGIVGWMTAAAGLR
jgi:16S rRNA U1498 N3-methylase RsmE